MDNNNKKTLDNLKNQEIDGENTKGGTSINKGTTSFGNSSIPYTDPLGTTAAGPGDGASNPLGIGTVNDSNPNADIQPLEDNGSDSISGGDYGQSDM